VISRKLAEEIRERLEKKEQVMVLLNRRGIRRLFCAARAERRCSARTARFR